MCSDRAVHVVQAEPLFTGQIEGAGSCWPLTRRQWLAEAGIAVGLASVGLARTTPVVADDARPAPRLLVYGGRDEPEALRGLLVVDAEQGTWRRVVEATVPLARLSPDGRTLLFCQQEPGDDNAAYAAWSCPVDGREEPKKIAERAHRVFWSPDGKEIITSFLGAGGNGDSESFVMRADGSHRHKLAIPSDQFVDDWSPDGEWLVTSGSSNARTGRSFVRKRDGTEAATLDGTTEDFLHRFTPDSRGLLFLRRDSGPPRKLDLFAINRDGSGLRSFLAGTPERSPGFFCFSPDGKQIAINMTESAKNDDGQYINTRRFIQLFTSDCKPIRELELPQRSVVPLDWK